MKVKPVLILASLAVIVVSGCASDPSFNLLPPPLYERGSLEQPSANRNIASSTAVPSPTARQNVPATGKDAS